MVHFSKKSVIKSILFTPCGKDTLCIVETYITVSNNSFITRQKSPLFQIHGNDTFNHENKYKLILRHLLQ